MHEKVSKFSPFGHSDNKESYAHKMLIYKAMTKALEMHLSKPKPTE